MNIIIGQQRKFIGGKMEKLLVAKMKLVVALGWLLQQMSKDSECFTTKYTHSDSLLFNYKKISTLMKIYSIIQSNKSPMEFAKELVNEGNEYNGFNLILADIETKKMVYVTNRPKGEPITIQEVQPGIHVLSNAKLDSPWPKAQRLKLNFKKMLDVYDEKICVKEMIEKLMRDTTKADKSKLPRICSTDWELELSSIFVEVDTPLGCYGTRSTTALTIEVGGKVSFYELYLENNTWKEQIVNYWIEKLQMQ
ncbi:hypothetical protein KY285_021713 [Solanum tuberosum]|nr:hypothetical protein KY285_021713 [Solanum tuberosum]